MNKLIMGLSCLGVLSAVSCYNDRQGAADWPPLEKVSFFAKVDNDGVKNDAEGLSFDFKIGDLIKVYIVSGNEESTTAAKYYIGSDKTTGIPFTEEGTILNFIDDGSGNPVIKDGFYLESADNPGKEYTIKRFDIIRNNKKAYVLNEENVSNFSIVTGGDKNVAEVHIVSNESQLEGVETKKPTPAVSTESTQFNVTLEEITDKLNFIVQFKKSDGSYYNSNTDAADVIQLTISYGNDEVFKTENIFKEGNISGKAYEGFKITFPMNLAYYTNDFTIMASVKIGESTHTFTIPVNASQTIKGNKGPLVLTDSGGSSSTTAKATPKTKKSSSTLAFVGGDFETEMRLEKHRLKPYANIEGGAGINSSKALHIETSSASENDYVFSTLAAGNLPASYSKLTFKLKGTAASKSISINLYKKDKSYYKFNLGDITDAKEIKSSGSNNYNGSINTTAWVTITLDLSEISDLNTDASKDFLALKIGKESAFNIYLDDFYIE